MMYTVQISQDYNITIPDEIVQSMRMNPGDQLKFEMIDKDRAIFYKVE